MAGILTARLAQSYMISKLTEYDFIVQEWEEYTSYSVIKNEYTEQYMKDAIIFYTPKYKGDMYRYASLTESTDKVNGMVLTIYGSPLSEEDIEKMNNENKNPDGDILVGGKFLSHVNNYPKTHKFEIQF